MFKTRLLTASLFLCPLFIFSFFTGENNSPEEKMKSYYSNGMMALAQEIATFKTGIEQDRSTATIRASFLQSRLAYKKVELILEYYFELDVAKFNGLAVNFIEEEDPTAYQEPQGLQMIESFIYPVYDRSKKKELLRYTDQLLVIANGLANNPGIFYPDVFVPDAAMEELYRILSLGITGFDSPIALLSLQEARASLGSVGFVMEAYKEAFSKAGEKPYNEFMVLLGKADAYLKKHNNFNQFDRAAFITGYLNPLSTLLGSMKTKAGFGDNPRRYSLIKKTGHLFEEKSLQQTHYLYDDVVTAAKIELGGKLFYEPLLSANSKRSCASCHQPGKGFTDGLPKALQADGHSPLSRNTPGLWNAYLQMNLFYDSRAHVLDDLIQEVLSNEKEMNSGADKGAAVINNNSEYVRLYQKAYPSSATAMTGKQLANAIGMYLRTLTSYNARFDQYMRGQRNAMNATEITGFNLFTGKAKCATCHYVPLFNGAKPPTYYYQESEVIGVPAFNGTTRAEVDGDRGRGPVLQRDFMEHAFKTPTLRNIALTAPYMHNGVYKTLEEVVDFYDKGGGIGLGIQLPNQTLPADKLGLTTREKRQLVAFLATLTDTTQKRIDVAH
jgi:cytochrome c peroxidase